MTSGHGLDSLAEAWQPEPGDLVKGFLRVPFPDLDGARHTYDNATTFVLARMVERVTGRPLEELLDERLFQPMGVDHAEWDRVASGAAFGFHGLPLTTEAVAAFGELLLCGGRWGDRQLVPREWVELATRPHIEVRPVEDDDAARGYGYQSGRRVAAGAWQGHTFFADLYVITTPHRIRLVVDADAGTAVATWSTVPRTSPDLALHLRSPLMTRPGVA